MATTAARQEISLKELPTKVVTLYPSRAHVVREINDVVLQPGQNEIEIYGVTPTADEHSVQVDARGHSAAVITDMTVDLVHNRDIFEEVYPDESDFELDDDESESDEEDEEIKSLDKKIKDLESQALTATEEQNTANNKISFLEGYARTIHAKDNDSKQLIGFLDEYPKKRMDIHASYIEATEKLTAIRNSIEKFESDRSKLLKAQRKAKAKVEKEKDKARARKQRQQDERHKEAARVKEERLKFWPKKVYRVIIRVEKASTDTPATSRRNSLDSVTLAQPADESSDGKTTSQSDHEPTISLVLSYITNEAWWSPRYDLNVSSLKKAANISYRAELSNRTSETWTDTKISLSTSSTSFTGLDDKRPTMHAWRVKLVKSSDSDSSRGLLSQEEQRRPRYGAQTKTLTSQKRSELFGRDETTGITCRTCRGNHWTNSCPQNAIIKRPAGSLFANNTSGGLFGTNPNPSNGFGATNTTQPTQDYQQQLMMLESQNKRRLLMARQEQDRLTDQGQMQQQMQQTQQQHGYAPRGHGHGGPGVNLDFALGGDDALENFDFESFLEPTPWEETAWEENGMTTSFDLPGAKSLVPSSLTRRHKIATLQAPNVQISYIAVPKLRNAAYLLAKFRNPSGSITLLSGTAGVTLDGSFLGTMNLQQAAPNQMIELPLGTDPGVHVSYPKPNVHRSTHGIFSKENAQAYKRAVWLTNTKATPVQLKVFDQVPLSEDERLKIDVVNPKGLRNEGDVVRAGISGKEASGVQVPQQQQGTWGKATATLGKLGEVIWNVQLEKGAACFLTLDYEARMPTGEAIVQT